MSEDDFMERLRDGDEKAWWAALAVLNQDAFVVARAVMSENDADSIAGEVLSEVSAPDFLKPLETFEELRTAVKTLARGKLMERIDGAGSENPDHMERISALYESPRALNTRRLGGKPKDEEKWCKLYQALRDTLEENLSERERRVVRLHYLDGFGVKMIAHYMALPLVIVAATFLKALDKIKQALRKKGIEPFEHLG